MLITFLSPAYAWQRIATHDELEHVPEATMAVHVHDGDVPPAEHEQHDAHGLSGHVLGHLPAFLSAAPTLPNAPRASSEFVEVALAVAHLTLEPPFRPPRLSSFA